MGLIAKYNAQNTATPPEPMRLLAPLPLPALLATFSWQELRHHPWRTAAAVVAVTLGVALGFAVQLINASALDEFTQGARTLGGEADLVLRSPAGQFDEAVYASVANDPRVRQASPVLEVATYAVAANGKRLALRVLGVDALQVAQVSPALMPLPDRPGPAGDGDAGERLALFKPGNVFLNAAAQAWLNSQTGAIAGRAPGLALQSGLTLLPVRVAGRVNAPGAALAVMDLGAAQELFGRQAWLSRIDVRLQPGSGGDAVLQSRLQSPKAPEAWEGASSGNPHWPPGLTAEVPGEDAGRLGKLSRAYRVNLTALALVALFTGAFLVFSVLSLSVGQRAPQLALLGVLGLTARQRRYLVLCESAFLGLTGSAAGIALGTALSAVALRLLGGDLGGGYFGSDSPSLHWNAGMALLYALLGVVTALAGGWWPARAAASLPEAQTLKGAGAVHAGGKADAKPWVGIILIAVSALLARAPALFGIPVAAYAAVAMLLVGGILVLPWLVAVLLKLGLPLVQNSPLALLAVERARRQRASANVAVGGVVAALSLAVALTVMVASFRESVSAWLQVVLPADLYLRAARSTLAGDTANLPPEFVGQVAALPGVGRLVAQRTRMLQLDAQSPPVALLARPLQAGGRNLPLVGDALPVPAGQTGVYVSEAMVGLYGAVPGTPLAAFNQSFKALALVESTQPATFFVAGVWRDYARQGGSVAMDLADYQRLSGDKLVNDLAIWVDTASAGPGIAAARQLDAVKAAIRTLGGGDLLEMSTTGELRATSLRIFDRSFAVTGWLQGVAIGIGLFGVAASFSAQVLARRKEFGLLAHLGLTRRQILRVVALESLAWTGVGALAGIALGLAVSVVLVDVVNPQSFHWTMDLAIPWPRLLALGLAVVLAGSLTAWLAGRKAVGVDAVLAVKEDW